MASSYAPQLIGGDAVLDFVNSVRDWTVAEPEDHLREPADAVHFGEKAGLLTRAEARRLVETMGTEELHRLRRLRARLHRILVAILAGRAPESDDLDALAREASAASHTVELRYARGALERLVDARTVGPATLRLRLADRAMALLTSPAMARLKSCPSCGWVFLDTTRNRSRRWCSMSMCGSVVKARRYYDRKRAMERVDLVGGGGKGEGGGA